jgi:putative tricarboxylic transport membrane protein
MEALALLGSGFLDCLSWANLLAAVVGVLLGTLAGVLPGLGITGTVAILLPFSYGMGPLTALIMISGIYFGSQYGGAITSVLVNIPGEATSIVTCFDGNPLAKQGRAGIALGISAISSFIGGTLGLIGLTFFAPPLAKAALSFGPPEFFAIATLGLLLLTNLAGKNPLRSAIMVLTGILLGTIGLDKTFGTLRFTFENVQLYKGIDFIIFIMGVFGIAELLSTICTPNDQGEVFNFQFRDLYPKKEDLKATAKPIGRGGIIGFLLGLIPGPSSIIATFASYGIEKKFSKHPEKFGSGMIEGVAAPESANNASMYAQMVPLMSLGIPFSSAVALLVSGFMIHGIQPGPLLITQHPAIFWGLIASLYIGNIFLLIINLPLVGLWASLLKIKFDILMPVITVITFTGAYAINNSQFDLGIMVLFGVIGFFCKMGDYDVAAMALGLFLGPQVEASLIQTLTMYDGSLAKMALHRPIAGTLCGLMILIVMYSMVKPIVKHWGQKINGLETK